MARQNRWTLVFMGLGIILMVEYLKIVVFIGDYEVESNELDDNRPLIPVEIYGNRSGRALKFKKISLSRTRDEEQDTIEEIVIAQVTKAKETTLRMGNRDHRVDETTQLLSKSEGGGVPVQEQGHRKNPESTETANDVLNPDLEHHRLPSKDDDGPGNSDKSHPAADVGDEMEIYIDTSRPVLNPHPFRYLLNSPDVCRDARVFLLCYVHTAVKHFKRRKRIRETWGNRTNYPGVEIRVVFFVGLPQLNTTGGRLHQEYLAFESKRYGDIVQEDFLDTYHNLSHKGVGALKWISTYCNHTAYVLKTDDDMFVNMYVILNHLRVLYAENFRRRLMMCYVFWKMHVDRQGGQWSLPRDYFPDDLYPPYCSGMGYVASVDVAIAMYRVSPYVRFLWVDDAFISGVLPAALQGAVNHTSWAKAYCAAYEMGVYTHPTEWYKYIFSHVHNETLNLMTWKGLTEIVRQRNIPRPSVIRPGLLADDYIPLRQLFPKP